MDKKLKPCPFCGKKNINIGNFHRDSGEEIWCIDHYCEKEEDELTVVLSAYGKTKLEVIKKWNKRIGDK